MAKSLSPVCKLCRREGEKLYLKGERCFTPKCSFERRSFAPGQHGRTGSRSGGRGGTGRASDYLRQLRAKQRARRVYGILERQFRRYYEVANQRRGLTGLNLLQILESRLDNVVYRLGIAPTRAGARQLVSHRHMTVNGTVVNVPSFQLKPGDIIGVREKSKSLEVIVDSLSTRKFTKFSWLEWDETQMAGKFMNVPERTDIPENIKEQLIVELYSKS